MAPGSVYTARAGSPPPHRLRPQAEGCGDSAYSEADMHVRHSMDHSTMDEKNCAIFGSPAPATCSSVPVKSELWLPRAPHAPPTPKYRSGLRIGYSPRYFDIIKDMFL